MAPSAIRRRRFPHGSDVETRRRRTIMAISSRLAAAQTCAGPALNGRFFSSTGKFEAEDEAVIVTVAVLLLLSTPTEQVTPASELETLQEKLALLPEKPLIGVKVSVEAALLPGLIVKVLGETLSEKSEGTVVKLKTLDHAPYTPGEEDKAFTCQ
jgi:hypothetical protein